MAKFVPNSNDLRAIRPFRCSHVLDLLQLTEKVMHECLIVLFRLMFFRLQNLDNVDSYSNQQSLEKCRGKERLSPSS